jgi:hypothetical protein
MQQPRTHALNALVIGALAISLVGAVPAYANGPRWQLSLTSAPTHVAPDGEAQVAFIATDIGNAAASGSTTPVTITEKLPPHVIATAVLSSPFTTAGLNGRGGELECSLSSPSLIRCIWSGPAPLPPYESLAVRIDLQTKGGAQSGEAIEATITGGGAPSRSVRMPIAISSAHSSFGLTAFETVAENEDGTVDSQAGSHPFQYTTTVAFNQTLVSSKSFGQLPTSAALVKDVNVELPPGLVGNPVSVPQCTNLEFQTLRPSDINLCPADTAIGVASVTIEEPRIEGIVTLPVPVFNLTPEKGEPARLGFEALGVPVVLDTHLRAGSDYGVNVTSADISQAAALLSSSVMLWGVPGDHRHDLSRGWSCLDVFAGGECTPTGEQNSPAFLSLPTTCGKSMPAVVHTDSWSEPGSFLAREYLPRSEFNEALALGGCNRLSFNPNIELAPESQRGSTPTGLNIKVHVPQDTTLASEGLAEADVKDTAVALPEGMQLSPSSVNGLEACSEGEPGGVGFTGFKEYEPETKIATFTSILPEEWESGRNFCPNGSKVGVVHVRSPLLSHELEGGVYLAAQNANPFGSLVALYIVAKDPVSGVLVKLAGEVHLDEHTGRVVTAFNNTPQVPFEDLKLEFFGGPQGPVSTPPHCGTYTTTASFTPWSNNPPVPSSSSFPITSGPNGSPCPNPQPFSPSLAAGSTNIQADAFTPFTMTMSREDGNQNLAGVQLHTPAGLLGMLSSVAPCPEPAASEGTCGPASLIGHTVVSVGLGSDPYTISGGQVFITGPYKGAPYGLSIAEPAKAGPFDLGSGRCDCVVVRAKIEIDPHTSALTITSDPLPTMLDGIPLQLKRVNVTADRSNFTFNPTNCSQLHIAATITSEQGATAPASVPFEVANCATLPFKPKFTVITQAHTSKASGASLHVKVTSGLGQANIAKVKTNLPKALPSRLTTLQKACPAATFEANPASCPSASVVGEGIAVTPVLKSALRGPAYLVSHAAIQFPDLEIVLQGEGITLVLDGQTGIKKGITSSTFRALPDAPIISFDLVLPEGPHSALTANSNLCKAKLDMPTRITGQNGAVLKQTTKIGVSGCHARKSFKARRHRKGGKGARHKK